MFPLSVKENIVSKFYLKHFVSVANISSYVRQGNNFGKQCFRNNVSLFLKATHVLADLTPSKGLNSLVNKNSLIVPNLSLFLVAKPRGQSQTRGGDEAKNQSKDTGKSKQQYRYLD